MNRFLFLLVICCALPVWANAQVSDSVKKENRPALDSAGKDTLALTAAPVFTLKNKLLNEDQVPVPFYTRVRVPVSKDALFYSLLILVLMLAVLRVVFPRYFNNLFRVFFNTSLRQSQLTDQLLQAKLPSLLFNLFFVFAGGVYVCLLLTHFKWIGPDLSWLNAVVCIGALGMAYSVKFSTLKFTGWISGFSETVNTYVFIIFLISKIIGIILVPFILLLAFADQAIVQAAITASLLVIVFMLLLRFIRSYSILQYQLKISRFHFFLYIIGVELLPLLLIYKGLVFLLDKNL